MTSFDVSPLLQGIVENTNERAFIVNFKCPPIIDTFAASFEIRVLRQFSWKLESLGNILGSQATTDKLGFGIDQHTQDKVYYSSLGLDYFYSF